MLKAHGRKHRRRQSSSAVPVTFRLGNMSHMSLSRDSNAIAIVSQPLATIHATDSRVGLLGLDNVLRWFQMNIDTNIEFGALSTRSSAALDTKGRTLF